MTFFLIHKSGVILALVSSDRVPYYRDEIGCTAEHITGVTLENAPRELWRLARGEGSRPGSHIYKLNTTGNQRRQTEAGKQRIDLLVASAHEAGPAGILLSDLFPGKRERSNVESAIRNGKAAKYGLRCELVRVGRSRRTRVVEKAAEANT
jgi:hypothetical protein